MASEQDYMQVDQWLDGNAAEAPDLDSDPDLKAYAEAMRQMRRAVRTVPAPEIADAQFRVFMDGIREGIAPPRREPRRWWALSSLAAASFLISLSVFYIFWGEPATVRATEVEAVSTELDGATMDWYENEDGLTTIWVSYQGEDL